MSDKQEVTYTEKVNKKDDKWRHEPVAERHPSLLVHTDRPFNAEPSNRALQSMITPKGQHYRRQHSAVPVVDPDTYKVGLGLEGQTLSEFSLSDLSIFEEKEIVVTLMCTGNRRSEFNTEKEGETMGLPWKNGSISTAKWTGVPLAQVLRAAGIDYDKVEAEGYRFMTFWGLEDYHVSIPLNKGFGRDADVILATKMNGETLPRDHGFPLRVVVPGYVGARSVKWLQKIVLSHEEVDGMHQKGIAYKQLAPNVKALSAVSKDYIYELPPVDSVPITSAITAPEPGASIPRGQPLEVTGYAYSGTGLAVVRVDVSLDGGESWVQGEISRASDAQGIRSCRAWAWVQWKCVVDIPADMHGDLQIICKAVDDQYNQQPHDTAPIWNIRGILNTAWGRVDAQVVEQSRL